MVMKYIFGDNGGGIFGGAKKVASTVGSAAGKVGSAAGSVQGAVVPSKAKLTNFWPTQEGREYLEELQSEGHIEDENHWAFQMLSSQTGQATQAYISRMISQHGYKGSKNQLVKNINEMSSAGYITGESQREEEEVSF